MAPIRVPGGRHGPRGLARQRLIVGEQLRDRGSTTKRCRGPPSSIENNVPAQLSTS
jgi:hypothetical protein